MGKGSLPIIRFPQMEPRSPAPPVRGFFFCCGLKPKGLGTTAIVYGFYSLDWTGVRPPLYSKPAPADIGNNPRVGVFVFMAECVGFGRRPFL